MLAAVITEGIAILLLAVLVLGLLRSHALILNALHELGAGLELEKSSPSTSAASAPTAANPQASSESGTLVELEEGVMPSSRADDPTPHDIVGNLLTGEERAVTVTAPGQRTLLAFLSSGCSVCKTFWDEFRSGNTSIPGDGRLTIIAQGSETESPSALAKLAGDLEVIQSSGAWTDYDIPGSPYFVYVDNGRITGEGSSTSWTQVRDLMAQAVDDDATRGGGGRIVEDIGRGDRDDLSRIDRELLAAGLTKDDPSLYLPPDLASQGAPHDPAHDHGGGHHHVHDSNDHNHRH